MTISMLKGKIHRATVTQAELDYVGSITVDIQLLEDAGIFEYEKVQIVDVNNGVKSRADAQFSRFLCDLCCSTFGAVRLLRFHFFPEFCGYLVCFF